MTSDDRPLRPGPPESEAGAPFWAASRERRLVLPWCLACEQPFWYPRSSCPRCLGTEIEWRDASGSATVYASSTMHRAAAPAMAERVPYVVALVDLDEGPRLMTNLVEPAPAGARVQVTWEPLEDGRNLPVFEPAG